jgi:hypothetical protein
LGGRGFFPRRAGRFRGQGLSCLRFGSRRGFRNGQRLRLFGLGSFRRRFRDGLDERWFLRDGFGFRQKLRWNFLDGRFSEGRSLDRWRKRFLGRRMGFHRRRDRFSLWHFHTAGAASNDIGAHPALDNGFPGLNFAESFVSRRDHAVRHYLFFAHMDLRLFLRRQSGAHARNLVVLKGTLGFAPSQTQLIQLGDEVLGLNSQFLS